MSIKHVNSIFILKQLESPRAKEAFQHLDSMHPKWRASINKWDHVERELENSQFFCAPEIQIRAFGDKQKSDIRGGWSATSLDECVIELWENFKHQARADYIVLVEPSVESGSDTLDLKLTKSSAEEYFYNAEEDVVVSMNYTLA